MAKQSVPKFDENGYMIINPDGSIAMEEVEVVEASKAEKKSSGKKGKVVGLVKCLDVKAKSLKPTGKWFRPIYYAKEVSYDVERDGKVIGAEKIWTLTKPNGELAELVEKPVKKKDGTTVMEPRRKSHKINVNNVVSNEYMLEPTCLTPHIKVYSKQGGSKRKQTLVYLTQDIDKVEIGSDWATDYKVTPAKPIPYDKPFLLECVKKKKKGSVERGIFTCWKGYMKSIPADKWTGKLQDIFTSDVIEELNKFRRSLKTYEAEESEESEETTEENIEDVEKKEKKTYLPSTTLVLKVFKLPTNYIVTFIPFYIYPNGVRCQHECVYVEETIFDMTLEFDEDK